MPYRTLISSEECNIIKYFWNFNIKAPFKSLQVRITFYEDILYKIYSFKSPRLKYLRFYTKFKLFQNSLELNFKSNFIEKFNFFNIT